MILKKKECNGCHQEKYIYKNVTVDGIRYKLCQSCAMKQDVKPRQTKTQISKTSKKKKKLDPLYAKLRRIYLEQHSMCQIGSAQCTSQSTEIHHSAYRGTNYLEVDTWFATCRTCHQWVHANPQTARELGYLK